MKGSILAHPIISISDLPNGLENCLENNECYTNLAHGIKGLKS